MTISFNSEFLTTTLPADALLKNTTDMKPQLKTILTSAAAVALFVIGLAAVFLLIGDEAPDAPMSIGEFILVKGAAMAVLAAVGFIAKKMFNRGLLPWITEQEENL